MKKEIWIEYEDPEIYDGTCAYIYTDGTYRIKELFINSLSEDELSQLKNDIEEYIRLNHPLKPH